MDSVGLITEVLNGGMNLILAVAVYMLWTKLNKKEEDFDDERTEMQRAFALERKEMLLEHRGDLKRLGQRLDNLHMRAWSIAEAFESVSDDGS